MIQIEISPEIEERFAAAAKAQGLEVASYARSLIESAARLNSPKRPAEKDLKDFFEAMAANADKIPDLSDYAYSRESFYEDHD